MYDFINSPFVIVSILVLGLGGIYLLACLLIKLLEKTKPAESSNKTNNYPHVRPRDASQTNTTSGNTDDFSNANTNTNASTNSGGVSNSASINSGNDGSNSSTDTNGIKAVTVAANSSSSSACSSGGSSGGGQV